MEVKQGNVFHRIGPNKVEGFPSNNSGFGRDISMTTKLRKLAWKGNNLRNAQPHSIDVEYK